MRTAVMEGNLSEFDLPTVMQVVSIGRQYTALELCDESGYVVGTLFLKSGKILDAKSGSFSGLDAVTRLLRGGRQRRFSVYRTDPFADVQSPVGSVGEVLLKLIQGEARAQERGVVMEGSLSEFDLLNVLQVISIGRQFTGVEVMTPEGKLCGKMELKSGNIVSARSNHLTGIDAVRRLLRSPRDSRFVVHRLRGEVGEQYLGSLTQILIQLADVDVEWDADESPTGTRHPVVADVVAAAPKAWDRREYAEDKTKSPFVDLQTSPMSLTTLPLSTVDIPVVCLTSPKGGAGKTTVALNLGIALARQGKRVVLVDSDFGGVLLALNAQVKAKAGAYEVVAGLARLADATIKTRISGLRIVHSGDPSAAAASSPSGWKRLFVEAQADADIVLVDTSAGARGPGGDACAAATHSLVVLPAEPAAIRALPAHLQHLESLGNAPPKVVGIVLNMLDYRLGVSLDVLRDLCSSPSAPWVFDIPIARSAAFMEAVARGVPVCRGDRTDTPTIGWVFEMLASGIQDRLGIAIQRPEAAPLLLVD